MLEGRRELAFEVAIDLIPYMGAVERGRGKPKFTRGRPDGGCALCAVAEAAD
jgi:hypothetical protein